MAFRDCSIEVNMNPLVHLTCGQILKAKIVYDDIYY